MKRGREGERAKRRESEMVRGRFILN